ncbi:hypothetical protein HDU97_003374 [Phlyctochytrium planicorne]|nr:hypothetical protein HDU97_003374 [Phlyctochytrium planicorne]
MEGSLWQLVLFKARSQNSSIQDLESIYNSLFRHFLETSKRSLADLMELDVSLLRDLLTSCLEQEEGLIVQSAKVFDEWLHVTTHRAMALECVTKALGPDARELYGDEQDPMTILDVVEERVRRADVRSFARTEWAWMERLVGLVDAAGKDVDGLLSELGGVVDMFLEERKGWSFVVARGRSEAFVMMARVLLMKIDGMRREPLPLALLELVGREKDVRTVEGLKRILDGFRFGKDAVVEDECVMVDKVTKVEVAGEKVIEENANAAQDDKQDVELPCAMMQLKVPESTELVDEPVDMVLSPTYLVDVSPTAANNETTSDVTVETLPRAMQHLDTSNVNSVGPTPMELDDIAEEATAAACNDSAQSPSHDDATTPTVVSEDTIMDLVGSIEPRNRIRSPSPLGLNDECVQAPRHPLKNLPPSPPSTVGLELSPVEGPCEAMLEAEATLRSPSPFLAVGDGKESLGLVESHVKAHKESSTDSGDEVGSGVSAGDSVSMGLVESFVRARNESMKSDRENGSAGLSLEDDVSPELVGIFVKASEDSGLVEAVDKDGDVSVTSCLVAEGVEEERISPAVAEILMMAFMDGLRCEGIGGEVESKEEEGKGDVPSDVSMTTECNVDPSKWKPIASTVMFDEPASLDAESTKLASVDAMSIDGTTAVEENAKESVGDEKARAPVSFSLLSVPVKTTVLEAARVSSAETLPVAESYKVASSVPAFGATDLPGVQDSALLSGSLGDSTSQQPSEKLLVASEFEASASLPSGTTCVSVPETSLSSSSDASSAPATPSFTAATLSPTTKSTKTISTVPLATSSSPPTSLPHSSPKALKKRRSQKPKSAPAASSPLSTPPPEAETKVISPPSVPKKLAKASLGKPARGKVPSLAKASVAADKESTSSVKASAANAKSLSNGTAVSPAKPTKTESTDASPLQEFRARVNPASLLRAPVRSSSTSSNESSPHNDSPPASPTKTYLLMYSTSKPCTLCMDAKRFKCARSHSAALCKFRADLWDEPDLSPSGIRRKLDGREPPRKVLRNEMFCKVGCGECKRQGREFWTHREDECGFLMYCRGCDRFGHAECGGRLDVRLGPRVWSGLE